MARNVKVAASLVGSFWWEVAAALKKAMGDDEFELDIDWSRYDHLNVRAVGSGECEIGVTMPPFLDWAMRRRGPLSDVEVPTLSVIAAVNLPTWLVAAVDGEAGLPSGVTTLRGLGEAKHPWKPIMPPADQLLRAYGERLLDLHGFSVEDVRNWGGDDPLPYARPARPAGEADGLPAGWDADRPPEPLIRQTQRLAAEGLTDGLYFFVNLGTPWAIGLSVLRNLRFLAFEDEALDTVRRELGAQSLVLPERVFAGVERDMPTIGWRHHYIYGREDTDPALVRAILAALERPAFLDNAMAISYTAVEPELVPGVDLHPAARAWYEGG
jgi:hypothetical protein